MDGQNPEQQGFCKEQECEVHCPGQIPHQIIPLRLWLRLGIIICTSCLLLQPRAPEQLLISSVPGLAECHSGAAMSPPSPLLCSRELHGKEANGGKCFEFLCRNLRLLLWLFFSAMEKSHILKTFLLFLQICLSFPWIHKWYKAARTVNSSHSLAAQGALKSCWSH